MNFPDLCAISALVEYINHVHAGHSVLPVIFVQLKYLAYCVLNIVPSDVNNT